MTCLPPDPSARGYHWLHHAPSRIDRPEESTDVIWAIVAEWDGTVWLYSRGYGSPQAMTEAGWEWLAPVAMPVPGSHQIGKTMVPTGTLQ